LVADIGELRGLKLSVSEAPVATLELASVGDIRIEVADSSETAIAALYGRIYGAPLERLEELSDSQLYAATYMEGSIIGVAPFVLVDGYFMFGLFPSFADANKAKEKINPDHG